MVTYFPNTWLVKKHHTVDLCAAFFTIVGCWSTIWAVNDVHCLLATKTTFLCWWAHFFHPSPEHWRLYCFPSFTFFSLPGYISPYIYFSKWIKLSKYKQICNTGTNNLLFIMLITDTLLLKQVWQLPSWTTEVVGWSHSSSVTTFFGFLGTEHFGSNFTISISFLSSLYLITLIFCTNFLLLSDIFSSKWHI